MVITTNKRLKEVWGDPVKTTYRQREILLEKPLFLEWYRMIYRFMAKELTGGDTNIEIGSGSSFLYEYIPGLLKSNIIHIRYNDLTFDVYSMPFKDGVVDNIFLIDVLHHLSDPVRFFGEARRVLRIGGRVLISDPYVSLLSYLIWRFIHPEGCNLREVGFNTSGGVNPLIDANSATATLLFKKDRHLFNKAFPSLRIKRVTCHTILHYWVAGGYNFPSFLPSFSLKIIKYFEKLLSPFSSLLASFIFIVLEKEGKF